MIVRKKREEQRKMWALYWSRVADTDAATLRWHLVPEQMLRQHSARSSTNLLLVERGQIV